MLKKLFTFGFVHITLHSCKNQFIVLDVASEIPLFEVSKESLKSLRRRSAVKYLLKSVILGWWKKKKFRLANFHYKVMKLFLGGL